MNNNYNIRKLEKEDIEIALEVIKISFEGIAEEYNLTIENCKSSGAFIKREMLMSDRARGKIMYGLFIKETMIGFFQLWERSNKEFILEHISVMPEYRHLGYGKKMLDFSTKEVKKFGGNKITLGFIEHNEKLKLWYLANGFTYKGKKKFKGYPVSIGFMEITI